MAQKTEVKLHKHGKKTTEETAEEGGAGAQGLHTALWACCPRTKGNSGIASISVLKELSSVWVRVQILTLDPVLSRNLSLILHPKTAIRH